MNGIASRHQNKAAGRRVVAACAVAVVATAGGLAACSNATTNPSVSPSASPTSPSASPSASAEVASYKVTAGGSVTVAGDPTQWTTSGGKMRINPNGGVGTGALAAGIEIDAVSTTPDAPSGWTLKLVTDEAGRVVSGSLVSPESEYTVAKKSGKINFLTTMNGTTVVTESPIRVVRGSGPQTTMNVNVSGTK